MAGRGRQHWWVSEQAPRKEELQGKGAEADSLARLGLSVATPGTLPWASLYHGHLVALRDGAVFLSPARAADAAYSATTAHNHALLLQPHPPGWSSHLLRLAYERAKVPALALRRIMHLRLLHSQSHPPPATEG